MKHICVSGASSGLGRAIALRLAGPELILSLWGRDERRLEETAGECAARGARVQTIRQDTRDLPAVRRHLERLEREAPLDCAFLAAGVITGLSPAGEKESRQDALRTFEVNLLGTVNMAACLLEGMKARGRGHLVFISSIAGLYPLPASPAYSASKIAVSYYARALAKELAGTGLRISCVYPGYLDTPMGRRLKAPLKPLVLEPDQAAEIILRRLRAGKNRIIFPFSASLAVRFLHLLPKSLADSLCARLGYTVLPDAESDLGGLHS